MRICLQNLGKYNEGELCFTWLELPCDDGDIEEALKKIGIGSKRWDGGIYEEYHIPDWECDIPGLAYSEWAHAEELNEIAEKWEELDESEQEIVGFILENDGSGTTIDSAIDDANSGGVVFIDGIESHYDLGYWDLHEHYCWERGKLPSIFLDYFNFREYGEDLCRHDRYTLWNGGVILDMR